MTVADSRHSASYLNKLWSVQRSDIERQEHDILDIRSSYLPTLITKPFLEVNQISSSHTTSHQTKPQVSADISFGNQNGDKSATTTATDSSSNHKGFRSRIRPSIFKGKCQNIAVDPESHRQLVKEKQALHNHRIRPKTPVSLEPVRVLSLSRPKSRRVKKKSQVSSA